MDPLFPPPPIKPRQSWPKRIFAFVSGLNFATLLLVLIGLLTWLATLEQIESGLHATLRKYFDWRAAYVVPEIRGELLPVILPGGYWVCVLLFINLALGGILRWRRGWQHSGVLIAHFGILYLLVAGAVAHHYSERGHLMIPEGGTSNVAEDYFEHVVEIAEIKDGKPAAIQVIRGRYLTDLQGLTTRTVRLPSLPFDLELARYFPNATPKAAVLEPPHQDVQTIDGYYLLPQPPAKDAETHTPGCIGRLLHRDGTKSAPFLLFSAAYQPFSVRHEDRVFTLHLRKRQWVMPFAVRLDKFLAEFYPGTMKPSKFVSEITRLENQTEAKAIIQMNEPMRYADLTFYQASYQQLGQGPESRMASVFEVVRNPADKWPEYSLYVVTFGLLVHFVLKLIAAIRGQSTRPKP